GVPVEDALHVLDLVALGDDGEGAFLGGEDAASGQDGADVGVVDRVHDGWVGWLWVDAGGSGLALRAPGVTSWTGGGWAPRPSAPRGSRCRAASGRCARAGRRR